VNRTLPRPDGPHPLPRRPRRLPALTSIEKGGVVLAALLFLGGLSLVIWPHAMVVVHLMTIRNATTGSSIEAVSQTGARVYGGLAMLCGTGLAALALYRRRVPK